MWARIEGGIVRELVEFDPAGLFSPDLQWVDCAPTVAVGDAFDGAAFGPAPAPTREQAKAARAATVERIRVTTQAGHVFDGDEVSQGRMSRAIIGLQAAGPGATVNWVLADNSVIQATAAELTEALILAGQAQAAVWVI